jgi:hypothetical protein
MQQEIKYIGFYDVPKSNVKRVSALPATNKMDYICDSIIQAGFKVHLVSPAWIEDSLCNAKMEGESTIHLTKNKKLTLVASIGTSNKFTRNLKIIYSVIWLFFWLVLNVKKEEKILVYHSPWLALPILLAKKIKRFYLILEVEEIYSDVSSLHLYFNYLEKEIIKNSDSFLFSTELLINKIGLTKSFIIIYGNYENVDIIATPANDGKIHLVYAGIIDSHKAGAFNAIESALFLPANYEMHIIGFGEIEKLNMRIDEINKISKCKVIYDGLKSGLDFVKYCQSCHIGLSTQIMKGDYLNTSFPSKILTYLSLGLKVVSCKVKCVKLSKIGDYVSYYEVDSPESIAKAICEIDINNGSNSQKIIKELNDNFVIQLKNKFSNE